MTCKGCRDHVERLLLQVEGVKSASVDLEKAEAAIETKAHIPSDAFQKALQEYGGRYSIHRFGKNNHHKKEKKAKKPNEKETGTFYCPMHCEADKTYDRPGNCSVCGMDLVVMEPNLSVEGKTHGKLLKRFWIAVAFTGPIFLIAMGEMLDNDPLYNALAPKYWNWIQLGLSIPVVFYAAWMFFERAYQSIRTWNLNMFTLIGTSAGVAWLFSVIAMLFPNFFPAQFKTGAGTVHVYYEAVSVVLTLVLLGQVLEARAHSKANSAVKELLKLTPNKAIRVMDGKEEEVSIEHIRPDDILRVKPGDKIPVDGLVTEGQTTIDESMITGEPVPVTKNKGDKVSSGTINGNRFFLMKAEKVGSGTLLSQIIKMVGEAGRSRAPIQKLADTVSTYFVPAVAIIAMITFMVWATWGPEPTYTYALVNAIAVLIIACPCALGLATPMSVMVGMGKAAQNGVLIKNAGVLEKMAEVDTLVVDKTGTITEGKPTVEKVAAHGNTLSEGDVLQYAVSLNSLSGHPLAEATVKYGKERQVQLLKTKNFKVFAGKGIEGTVDGEKVALGNAKMMEHANAEIPEELEQEARSFQKQGKTISYLSIDGEVVGYVAIGDKIKQTSAKAIKELQDNGIGVIMFTGDTLDTAQAMAGELHLTDFKAGMLPEDKLREIAQLQREGKTVAMAGDGINDAPAIAQSEVGIAMGTGTDVAIESAAITLVKGDLQGIVKARNLSGTVMKNIKQNLFFALIYNVLGVTIAAGVLYPFFGILLSPMIAALAMSLSSVSVITNALRLENAKI